MKDVFKVLGLGVLVIVCLIAISYSFGWIGVHQIKTIGKAKQNAHREVYEETNSFTKGKRQEIIKYYKEWKEADSVEDKKAIESIVSMSLADFDEDRFITDATLLSWIKGVKY